MSEPPAHLPGLRPTPTGPGAPGNRRTRRRATAVDGRRRAWRVLVLFAAAPLLATVAFAAMFPDTGPPPSTSRPGRTTSTAAPPATHPVAQTATPTPTRQGVPADLAPLGSGPASGYLARAGVSRGGRIRSAWTWSDGDGRHLLVTMRTAGGYGIAGSPRSVTLRVALLDHLDTRPTLVRQLGDSGLHCAREEKLTADFTPNAFVVRDLDGDGTAEVSVGWTAACTGSGDGTRVRLALMSGDQLFVVRARADPGTAPDAGTGTGTLTVAPVPNRWPRPFLDSALTTFHEVYF